MKKRKTFIKPLFIAGMVALCMVIGISGCGTKSTATTSSTQQGTDSTTTNQQPKQGQNPNPAVKAAMDIILLQKNTQVVLTSEQKSTIKPILTELISSTDTTQDYLQKKADAITTVFTDTQKSFLTKAQKPQGESNSTGTPPTGTDKKTSGTPPTTGTPPTGASQNDQSGTKSQSGNQNGQPQPKDIFTQALNALT